MPTKHKFQYEYARYRSAALNKQVYGIFLTFHDDESNVHRIEETGIVFSEKNAKNVTHVLNKYIDDILDDAQKERKEDTVNTGAGVAEKALAHAHMQRNGNAHEENPALIHDPLYETLK